jgi:anthranilate synthase/aminodeoxychorismate synthase-like glutamine amidotransferase
VKVVRNDAVTLEDIARLGPDQLVVSPGPGRPEGAGVTVAAVQRFSGRIPVLGVCLGHQALAVAFGGRVDRAPVPMHGKVSRATHDESGLFAGIETPFDAGRYHSLIIPADGVPEGFVVNARVDDDGAIMAIRHERHPTFGLQFHPESVLTVTGHQMLRNFLEVR